MKFIDKQTFQIVLLLIILIILIILLLKNNNEKFDDDTLEDCQRKNDCRKTLAKMKNDCSVELNKYCTTDIKFL